MPNRGIDVNDWIAWRNRCETYARDFFGAVVYAGYEQLRRLTREHDCAQVRELIDILDYPRPILQQDPSGCILQPWMNCMPCSSTRGIAV